MIKIGFINPTSYYLHDPFRGDPHTHFQILTVLKDYFEDKIGLSLIDLRGIKREFVSYHIPECDVYLQSLYTLDYNEQKSMVEFLRKRYPKAKHIVGGPHANIFQKESLKIFDSIILGDGEETIKEVVDDLEKLDLKKIYRQKSKININNYPFPRRDYLNTSSVARKGLIALRNKKGFEELLSATAIFSRGCPYSCSFCAIPQMREYNLGIRYKSQELVRAEIEYLKKDFKVQGLNILDEIGIPLNKNKAISHLEAIASTDIIWRGQCRVDGITEEIAKIARKSGCVSMGLGVESISQKSLDIINKRVKIGESRKTIELLHKNDIEVRIYLIIGLPGEPKDIVERTWGFIEETKPEVVHLSLFTIRPGTEVYNNKKKFAIKKIDSSWDKTMHMYGRYEDETPIITFEYEKMGPWGKSFTREEIVSNYQEIQRRLREKGLSNL